MPSRTRAQESHTPQVDLKFRIPAGKDNLRVDVPAFEIPAEIADAGTIGIIYDEIGGLNFYNEYHRAEFSRGSFADMRGILPG